MAQNKNTVMPETGIWPAGIYQIETTDPVLGYNPKTDKDGPANIQWEQLANRTRYLRNLFLVEHDEEGRHSLTNEDFVTAAGIKESNIDLDYPTQELSDDIDALIASIQETYDELDSDIRSSLLGLTWALMTIIPLAWERQGDRCAFEMFTESMHLSHGKSFKVFKAVHDTEQGIGDDSVDVTDTGWNTEDAYKIKPGEWYVLSDSANASKWQFVSIAEVLNNQRILLNEESRYTTTDGWLRPANVKEADMKATSANKAFSWISDVLSTLASEDDITVTIRHNKHTARVPVVEYLAEGAAAWVRAVAHRKERFQTYEDDICTIPSMDVPFRVRVSYSNLTSNITFTMIALVARHEYDVIEVIRRPSVLSAVTSGSNVVVSGSEYLSLYEVEQGGMDAQLSADDSFSSVTTVTHSGDGTQITTSKGSAEYVRIRYKDIEGAYSRWSEPEAIR